MKRIFNVAVVALIAGAMADAIIAARQGTAEAVTGEEAEPVAEEVAE